MVQNGTAHPSPLTLDCSLTLGCSLTLDSSTLDCSLTLDSSYQLTGMLAPIG